MTEPTNKQRLADQALNNSYREVAEKFYEGEEQASDLASQGLSETHEQMNESYMASNEKPFDPLHEDKA
jgi:hypothetical protein